MGRKPTSARSCGPGLHCAGERGDVEAGGRRGRVSKSIVRYWLTQSGGVRPRQRRARPLLRLCLEERETISPWQAQKKTLTAIAAGLGRSTSTVSREESRNSGPGTAPLAQTDWQ